MVVEITSTGEEPFWGSLRPLAGSKALRLDLWTLAARYAIGRHPDNELVLVAPAVSARHCEIAWGGARDPRVIVYDLSSNGTYINEVKIGRNHSAELKNGDVIAFGDWKPNEARPEIDFRYSFYKPSRQPSLEVFYARGEVLGQGSFGEVFKVRRRDTGVWYAAKVLHLGAGWRKEEARALELGKNEAEIAAHKQLTARTWAADLCLISDLKHENVLELVEVFKDAETLSIVLPLCDSDLLVYLHATQQKTGAMGLEEEEAVHITRDICAGMAYLHDNAVVHRDIKPENILLQYTTKYPHARIADFGLAKVKHKFTTLRTLVGTRGYIAPEVWKLDQERKAGREGQAYDELADSWSVGCVVLNMLTGIQPLSTKRRDGVEPKLELVWKALTDSDYDDECAAYEFVERLLEPLNEYRMSMHVALKHPWLADSKA